MSIKTQALALYSSITPPSVEEMCKLTGLAEQKIQNDIQYVANRVIEGLQNQLKLSAAAAMNKLSVNEIDQASVQRINEIACSQLMPETNALLESIADKGPSLSNWFNRLENSPYLASIHKKAAVGYLIADKNDTSAPTNIILNTVSEEDLCYLAMVAPFLLKASDLALINA